MTLLGDDLFSRAPLIKQLIADAIRFIFVAKPTSHTYLNTWIEAYDTQDKETCKVTETKGNQKHIYTYTLYRRVPLNGQQDAPDINYS